MTVKPFSAIHVVLLLSPPPVNHSRMVWILLKSPFSIRWQYVLFTYILLKVAAIEWGIFSYSPSTFDGTSWKCADLVDIQQNSHPEHSGIGLYKVINLILHAVLNGVIASCVCLSHITTKASSRPTFQPFPFEQCWVNRWWFVRIFHNRGIVKTVSVSCLS